VTPPDQYRCHLCSGQCSLACAAEIGRVIEGELPETVAGVILEPAITGGGVIVPADSYLPEVRAICDRSGALMIVDEAVCGFGRTGKRFGFQQSGVLPDIVTMAKGVTSGYFPFAVTAVRKYIHRAFSSEGHGRLRHINTFGGHPVGCAVALANMEVIEREDLCARANRAGQLLRTQLAELTDVAIVGEVRGTGLLIGIELVADLDAKRPLEPAAVQAVVAGCLRRGLIVGSTANTTATSGNVIIVGPPLIVTDEEITFIVATLHAAIAEVGATVRV
jgi:taurine-pyruvate aminotransferase